MKLFALFFTSGISGLIYQVIWVREFGKIFGNTIHSAALVTAVFMLGLGLGSYFGGKIADKEFRNSPQRPLKLYAYAEILIGFFGFLIALILPRLEIISPLISHYVTNELGWHVLSRSSYLWRILLAAVLLAPITLLMGATLTLLIRFIVHNEIRTAGQKIGLLYGVNTAGAMLGCFLVDFLLIPNIGLFASQMIAVICNYIAGLGGIMLFLSIQSQRKESDEISSSFVSERTQKLSRKWFIVAFALFFTGAAGMGLEIVWFRFLTSFLGNIRTTFSLLLTVILAGILSGSFFSSWLARRFESPGKVFILLQSANCVLIVSLFFIVDPNIFYFPDIKLIKVLGSYTIGYLLNLKVIILLIGLPAFFMGTTFPLGNAIALDKLGTVGTKSGLLYLFNTLGGVLGSLVTGFFLLGSIGTQASIGVTLFLFLISIALIGILEIKTHQGRYFLKLGVPAATLAIGAIIFWMNLNSDFLMKRIYSRKDVSQHAIYLSESITDTIAITERRLDKNKIRTLYVNGQLMSGSWPWSQRYMRAFSHFPLLHLNNPQNVLVICFGVGITAHAASLHPTVKSIEIADLSGHVLKQAHFFNKWNKGILDDPRVKVFVNDGRQHLRMQENSTYDLITLEPPPISTAGVASLYSKEFYQLSFQKLKDGGFITQWLPAYQVGGEITKSMIRSFIDIFPDSMMISGFKQHLILMGRKKQPIRLEPEQYIEKLKKYPLVAEDLRKNSFDSVSEFFGSFVSSYRNLNDATIGNTPISDDFPLMEYSVKLSFFHETSIPKELFRPEEIGTWCPTCLSDRNLSFKKIKSYLRLMKAWYQSDNFLFFSTLQDTPDFKDTLQDPDNVMKNLIKSSHYLQEIFNVSSANPPNQEVR